MTPGVAPPTLLEIVSRPAETVAQNSGGGAAHPRVDGRILGGRMNGRTMTAGSSAMRAPAENAGGSGPGTASSNPLPDNAALVAALIRGEPGAWTELVDRFGPDVERLVAGALGVDADLADIVQDVFVRVIERIHQLRDPGALKGWIASVAVFAARGHIRKRRRWRWIRFLAPADIPDVPATTASPENHALVHSTYKLLDTLPDNERMAFSLRFVAEMELTEVAAACGVSLATIKRRLARAEIHFVEGARRDPALNERIERGERWRNK
jgi:RNA polymerase sigma-70 factor (ECF subfamily)